LLDAIGGAACDVRDLGAGGRGQRVEDERAVLGFAHVDAIERQYVSVHIHSERAVRPLDGRNGAGVRVRDAAEREQALGAALKRAAELADEGADDLRAQRPVVAQEGAQAPGERADPVPHGHHRQDALLEVHGHIGHPSTAAGGAECSLLAAERDELRVPAAAAGEVQTARLQAPAEQVRLELAHDEFG
jgi:hypothetical protein